MNLIRRVLIIAFVLMTNAQSFGQIGKHLFNEVSEEAYNPKDFTIKTKPIKQRIGVYHFGNPKENGIL